MSSQDNDQNQNYNDPSLFGQTNPQLYLQAFLAEIESKTNTKWLNKDFGYTKLDKEQIHTIASRGKTLNTNQHILAALRAHETGIPQDVEEVTKKYSALQYLISQNAADVVLNMSEGGWARELGITQRHIIKGTGQKVGRKLLGLRKNKDTESYE